MRKLASLFAAAMLVAFPLSTQAKPTRLTEARLADICRSEADGKTQQLLRLVDNAEAGQERRGKLTEAVRLQNDAERADIVAKGGRSRKVWGLPGSWIDLINTVTTAEIAKADLDGALANVEKPMVSGYDGSPLDGGRPDYSYALYACIWKARLTELQGQPIGNDPGAPARPAGAPPIAAVAPPPTLPPPASATPQPPFVKTLQLAPAAASRTNCLQGSLEPGSLDKVNRRTDFYLVATEYGNTTWTNWEIFVLTNTCSENVTVYAAGCSDVRMSSTYTGGDGNLPAYPPGAQAGVGTSLSGGSGDGAGQVLPPGRKLIIASQGDDAGLWGRHPLRTSISQAAYGAVSQAASSSGAIGDYGRWKSDVWNEMNRVAGRGSNHYNLGTFSTLPSLWKGARCADTNLASPGH